MNDVVFTEDQIEHVTKAIIDALQINGILNCSSSIQILSFLKDIESSLSYEENGEICSCGDTHSPHRRIKSKFFL